MININEQNLGQREREGESYLSSFCQSIPRRTKVIVRQSNNEQNELQETILKQILETNSRSKDFPKNFFFANNVNETRIRSMKKNRSTEKRTIRDFDSRLKRKRREKQITIEELISEFSGGMARARGKRKIKRFRDTRRSILSSPMASTSHTLTNTLSFRPVPCSFAMHTTY